MTSATAPAAAGERSRPRGSSALQALPPLSLYIHMPWCVRKCPYCDFNSHEARGEIPEAAYVDALIADLEQALPLVWGRRVYTIFFGGGTPSLLSAQAIDTLLSAVRARVPLAVDAEITLEANPGTFEAEKFAGFRAAGVNRLSIGIQSFDARAPESARAHPRRRAGRAARSRSRASTSTTSTSISCMRFRGRRCRRRSPTSRAALAFEPPHLSRLSPDDRAQHLLPSLPAGRARRRRSSGDAGRGRGERCARRATPTTRRPRMRRTGTALAAQPQLLDVRRLPRHRRGRPQQALLPRAHRAPGALPPAARVHGAGGGRQRRAGRARGGGGRCAVRIHDERAAPDRRLCAAAVRRARGGAARLGAARSSTKPSAADSSCATTQRVVPTELGRRFLNDLLQIFLRG